MHIKENIMNLKKRPFIILFGVLVLVEILYLFYFNFANLYNGIDQDSAKLMTHMIEIVRNKKLLVPNWYYISTHEIDCSMLVAIPFYIISKNVWISFALSNCIHILLLLFVLIWIFHNFDYPMEYALLASSIIFVPYCFGIVDYLNMLFFRGAQYGIKSLIPLLGVAILTYNKNNALKIVSAFVWIGLVFLCGFSSSSFIFVSAIVPLLVAYCINYFSANREAYISANIINLQNLVILILGTAASIVGLVICNSYQNSDWKVSPQLVSAYEIPGKIHDTMIYFLQLINSLPTEGENLNLAKASDIIPGGGYVLRFILILFILSCTVHYAVDFFKNKKSNTINVTSKAYINYLIAIVITNIFIHFLTRYSERRYYLIEFLPMALLSVIFFANWIKKLTVSAQNLLKIVVGLGMAFIWFTSVLVTNNTLQEYNFYSYTFELCKIFQYYDVDNIITIDQPDVCEICRLILPEQKISNYSTEDHNYFSRDYYIDVDSASWYGNSSLIATAYYDDLSSIFGEDVASEYEFVGQYYEFNLFLSRTQGVPTSFTK